MNMSIIWYKIIHRLRMISLENCYMVLLKRLINRQKKRGRDLTQSHDKSPYTNRNVKGQSDNTNNATKKFDYTAVVDIIISRWISHSRTPDEKIRPEV